MTNDEMATLMVSIEKSNLITEELGRERFKLSLLKDINNNSSLFSAEAFTFLISKLRSN